MATRDILKVKISDDKKLKDVSNIHINDKRFVFMSTSLMWTNMMNNVDLDVLSVRSRASTSWFSLGFWMVLFCWISDCVSQPAAVKQQSARQRQRALQTKMYPSFYPTITVSPSDSLFCHLTEVGVGQRSEAPTRVLKPEESACKSRLNIIPPPVRN